MKTSKNMYKEASIKPLTMFTGTFGFCNGCPSYENCCTGKSVDLPVLIPEDLIQIHNVTGLNFEEFSGPTSTGLWNMKKKNGKCYFYKDGGCSIYDIRPIDCRLFPFDIRLNSKGELILVYYVTACPKLIQPEEYINKIKFLTVGFLKPYMKEFALHKSPLLDCQKFKVVDILEKYRDDSYF